ncbi:DUF3310 domain-containing protein [Hyphomicrobium sp.]|uniref:DUF3310 domain-containing protein n=1 Tax=Hyphomicrobium sp. TaxID=82 RepID=UPI001D5F773B|nr:DUF3310 domain-containing protein [Hyphomicrobium sp.]MBY0561417.1 DUF3310 domain-containing protein [Hyphomicrobium sp.]
MPSLTTALPQRLEDSPNIPSGLEEEFDAVTRKPVKEAVNNPAHYGGGDNPYEVIKVLEQWMTPEEFIGFCRGNIIKYQARARAKNGLEDEKKAAWYGNYLTGYKQRKGIA